MSEWFPLPRQATGVDGGHPVRVDPGPGERVAERRWEVRAAQWRARELAEQVFGGEVFARLTGQRNEGSFRGLLHLEVPFSDLERHRALEAVFLACASADPALGQVAFVYVIGPRLP